MTDEKIINEIKKSPFKLWDIVLVVLLVLASFLPIILTTSAQSDAKSVIITQNGNTESYSLEENRQVQVDGLTVIIEDGRVFVKDATCPDKICQHSGKIENAGESIVCLPNGVIVKISGENEFDASTGEGK